MLRVYRYRLYPTRAQDALLRQTLERLRELYNAALQERRDAYQKQRITLSAFGQMAELCGVREVREDSRCGAVVRKSLAVRVHACPACGLVLGRDHNAAIIIENRPGHGRRGRGERWRDPLIPRSPFLTPTSA